MGYSSWSYEQPPPTPTRLPNCSWAQVGSGAQVPTVTSDEPTSTLQSDARTVFAAGESERINAVEAGQSDRPNDREEAKVKTERNCADVATTWSRSSWSNVNNNISNITGIPQQPESGADGYGQQDARRNKEEEATLEPKVPQRLF